MSRHGVFARSGSVAQATAAVLFFTLCSIEAPLAATTAPSGISSVIPLVDAGDFRAANRRIDQALQQSNLSDADRRALEFERERMRRILLDFSLDEAGAKERVRRQIPDLKDSEFAAWDAAGLLESRVIDGQKRYFGRAPSNLFRLSAEARARRSNPTPFTDSPLEAPHAHHREVIDSARATGKTSVAPRRVRVTQSITVDADAVPAGETVRAWIPYPRAIPGQHEDIRFIESSPLRHQIAPESTLQRTVYLEQPAAAGKPAAFSITYEVTIYGQHYQIDPAKVVPAAPTPELKQFLGERPPHIVFTDAMRQFSREAVGDEKNPYRIAQKLFTAVDRIPWAGALEYSTITNISNYALHAGHADCGQQTLLLMTLLRLNGIPARWQSGWIFADTSYNNMHDWGWLYLAPYGWVPMDVTFGKLSSGNAELDAFYLGSFDAYRIAFNDDYSQPFVPPKQHFRSETVDLQRGEVEWRGGNLYFDRWDYDFKATLLPLPANSQEGSQ
ncbi:transglutaminase-like putative cysteine protease [Povalibacter uvarum]|uniref:Transglutaminase-like putative cysteine protease n=1 Tax=Povalibacter uvarum TaxID=732238 RepID=A0A841HPR8_9GAMM|nr:transglutaminase-like domain-containing protein [Povalibacter uvarum]MBB6094763.1 transglutaminase-like putative cysteine protease [Povalibacter uvarum]